MFQLLPSDGSFVFSPHFQERFSRMRIASVATAYPPYRYPQALITEALQKRRLDRPGECRLRDKLHSNCGVEHRHLMFPIDNVGMFSGFGESNDAWIEGATQLGQQAIQTALDKAGPAGGGHFGDLFCVDDRDCDAEHRRAAGQHHEFPQQY